MSERLTVEQIEVFRWDMLTNRHLKHAICEAALRGIQHPDLEAAALQDARNAVIEVGLSPTISPGSALRLLKQELRKMIADAYPQERVDAVTLACIQALATSPSLQAHSKSEYKRMSTLGANVLPPDGVERIKSNAVPQDDSEQKATGTPEPSPYAAHSKAAPATVEYKPDGNLLAEVERREDMSIKGSLKLLLQEDGDIIVAVNAVGLDDLIYSESVEFCTSGGKSRRTLLALRNLMAAMQADNRENPLPPADAK